MFSMKHLEKKGYLPITIFFIGRYPTDIQKRVSAKIHFLSSLPLVWVCPWREPIGWDRSSFWPGPLRLPSPQMCALLLVPPFGWDDRGTHLLLSVCLLPAECLFVCLSVCCMSICRQFSPYHGNLTVCLNVSYICPSVGLCLYVWTFHIFKGLQLHVCLFVCPFYVRLFNVLLFNVLLYFSPYQGTPAAPSWGSPAEAAGPQGSPHFPEALGWKYITIVGLKIYL